MKLVLPLTQTVPKDIDYFGNFTLDQLDQQLAVNGFNESEFFGNTS